MSAAWSTTMALSAVESEIWSGTRFAAVGLLEPQRDGRVRFEYHTRAAMVSAIVGRDHLKPGGVIDQTRSAWNVGPLARVPLGTDDVELIGGLHAEAPSPDDVAALHSIARRLEAAV